MKAAIVKFILLNKKEKKGTDASGFLQSLLCLLGKDCGPIQLPFAASLLLGRGVGGWPSCWLFFLGCWVVLVAEGGIITCFSESSLVSPSAAVALSNLVSRLFKGRGDGYSQNGRSGTCSWEALFCSLLGKGMFQELKAFHCYLHFCSVKVLPFWPSTEKRPASGKFRLSFFK